MGQPPQSKPHKGFGKDPGGKLNLKKGGKGALHNSFSPPPPPKTKGAPRDNKKKPKKNQGVSQKHRAKFPKKKREKKQDIRVNSQEKQGKGG